MPSDMKPTYHRYITNSAIFNFSMEELLDSILRLLPAPIIYNLEEDSFSFLPLKRDRFCPEIIIVLDSTFTVFNRNHKFYFITIHFHLNLLVL